MEENIEANRPILLETIGKIKEIEDKYNRRKSWILGISAAVILGSSWHGFRSLNYADQMEFLNPYAGSNSKYMALQRSYKVLKEERDELKLTKNLLEILSDDLGGNKPPYQQILEVRLEDVSKYVNDRLLNEEDKLKSLEQDLEKEHKGDKNVRKQRRVGVALYFVNMFTTLAAGALLTLNRLAKEDETKKYTNP